MVLATKHFVCARALFYKMPLLGREVENVFSQSHWMIHGRWQCSCLESKVMGKFSGIYDCRHAGIIRRQ
jgi:hypothetical protein